MIDLIKRDDKLLLVLDKENLDTLFDYASRNKYFKVKLYQPENQGDDTPEKIYDVFIEPCGINKDDGLGLLAWVKDPDTETITLVPMRLTDFEVTSDDGKELIAYKEFDAQNYFTIYNDFSEINFDTSSPVGITNDGYYVYKFVKQDTKGIITVSIINADSTDITNRRTFTFDPSSDIQDQGYALAEIDPVIPTVITQKDVDRDLLQSLNNRVKKLELLNADPDLVEAKMLTSWETNILV